MLSTSAPCCLVVEDEALIGMALEASLEGAGFRIAGPFVSNAAALAWLDGHTPDLALLDVLLRDGPCTSLVRALRRRNIPFAIYSGLKPRSPPPQLAAVPWLEKPAAREDLTRVLRQIASPSAAETASAATQELAGLDAPVGTLKLQRGRDRHVIGGPRPAARLARHVDGPQRA